MMSEGECDVSKGECDMSGGECDMIECDVVEVS